MSIPYDASSGPPLGRLGTRVRETLLALVPAGLTAVIAAKIALRHVASVNSDELYLTALFRDMRNGTPLEWHLTPAPYFFPDWIAYALSGGFGDDLGRVFAVYAALMTLLFLFGFGLLARTLSAPSWHGVLVGSAVFAAVAASDGSVARFWVVPTFHGGLLAMLPTVLAVFLAELREPRARRRRLLVGLTTLIAASDLFVVPQFILPAAVVALAHRRRRLATEIVMTPIVGSLFVRVMVRALWHWHIPPGISLPTALRHVTSSRYWTDAADAFLHLVTEQPFAFVLALSGVAYAGFVVRRAREDGHGAATALAEFLIASAIVGPLIVTFAGLYDAPIANRYLLPVLALPPASLLALRASWPKNVLRGACVVAIVACAMLSRRSDANLGTPYPDDVACVDALATKHGWTRGYSSYWLAKRSSLLSHRGLTVLAVDDELLPYEWITNRAWYGGAAMQFALAKDGETAYLEGYAKKWHGVMVGNCGEVAVFQIGDSNATIDASAGAAARARQLTAAAAR